MARLAILMVLCACGGKSASDGPAGDSLRTRVPKVESATVLAVPPATDEVPVIVFVEEDGKLVAGAGPATWPALASFQPSAKDLRALHTKNAWRVIREDVAFERSPREIVESLANLGTETIDLETLEEARRDLRASQDDPPPPEEEDRPDDGADESGGTGTAMALEEGKLGKQDADRAEGQYKMKKTPQDPQLARRYSLARERAAMLPGPRGQIGLGAFASLTGTGSVADEPQRLGTVAGAIEDPKHPMEHQRVAIAARRQAKASAVIDALTQSEGALLVAHGADVRPLRLLFGPSARERGMPQETGRWIELRVTAKEVVFEAVPDKPIVVAWATPRSPELGKTFTALAAKYPRSKMTDVLVAPDVDAQRLVDVLAALDAAGARSIALGLAPAAGDPQSKLRGKRIVRFTSGHPNAQGAIEKSELRRIVGEQVTKLRACYETALAAKPDLAGTVLVQFMIDVKGRVWTVDASGVDPDVADCIKTVIKTLQFPPSKDGPTQVNYPFSMSN